jgi:hypothetical protein
MERVTAVSVKTGNKIFSDFFRLCESTACVPRANARHSCGLMMQSAPCVAVMSDARSEMHCV